MRESFSRTPLGQATRWAKQPIFSPNTVGIRDAKFIVGVVLRVATTSFGERLGARQSFRLSATTPPVGGKSRSQSIFSEFKKHYSIVLQKILILRQIGTGLAVF